MVLRLLSHPPFRRALWLVALGIWTGVLLTAPAGAQQPASDDEVNAVAKGLYCPVCESTPLDVCATQACADWRELIREKLTNGETPQEIEAYFARQYGDKVLAEPPRRGFTLLVWILPVVAVIVGGGAFTRYLLHIRRGRNGATETSGVSPAPSAAGNGRVEVGDQGASPPEEYIARVEDELRRSSP